MAFPVWFWYFTPKNYRKVMHILALFRSLCMVNVSKKLIADSGGTIDGVRDLKTTIRRRTYVDIALKILLPALQNVLKIPLERTTLAQGRITALPNHQRSAEIDVGIGYNGNINNTLIARLAVI